MHPSLEAGHAHRVMQQGGNSDANRLHLIDQAAVIGIPAAVELGAGKASPRFIGVGNTN